MKYSTRRAATGQMLMDVTKYLLTIGLIGGILTEKVGILSGVSIVAAALALFMIAFITIPPSEENE